MKSILLICDQPHVDIPLRRSLAHLVNSCQIGIVHNGNQAFDELAVKAFDLIIIDFEIPGVDSLELVESIQYIDPGVPVILMVRQAHVAVWDTARHLKAQPIVRPFNPIDFLRLIDKLLHQQLNRYRRLAGLLQNILEKVRLQTEGLCAFLADETGQPLVVSGEVDGLALEALAGPLVDETVGPVELHISADQARALFADSHVTDYGLYIGQVADNLNLVLLAPVAADLLRLTAAWYKVDGAALDARDILRKEVTGNPREGRRLGDTAPISPPAHTLIPVILRAAYAVPPTAESIPDEGDETQLAVNWALINHHTNLLGRLEKFCQID